jgi:hypothetical protein
MKKLKTTPWFIGYKKPLKDRIGPYERVYPYKEKESYLIFWCWWDGKFFGSPAESPEQSKNYYYKYGRSKNQNLQWRGVLK